MFIEWLREVECLIAMGEEAQMHYEGKVSVYDWLWIIFAAIFSNPKFETLRKSFGTFLYGVETFQKRFFETN